MWEEDMRTQKRTEKLRETQERTKKKKSRRPPTLTKCVSFEKESKYSETLQAFCVDLVFFF